MMDMNRFENIKTDKRPRFRERIIGFKDDGTTELLYYWSEAGDSNHLFSETPDGSYILAADKEPIIGWMHIKDYYKSLLKQEQEKLLEDFWLFLNGNREQFRTEAKQNVERFKNHLEK